MPPFRSAFQASRPRGDEPTGERPGKGLTARARPRLLSAPVSLQAPLPPGPGQPSPPKKRTGCFVAAMIAAGVGLLVVLVVGFFVWKAGRVVLDMARDGMNAPGTAEVRAAGCDTAMVMSMDKLLAMFDAAGAPPGKTPTAIVSCVMNAGKTPPTCDEVARAYVGAVPSPTGPFTVTVQVTGILKSQCQKLYDQSGKAL